MEYIKSWEDVKWKKKKKKIPGSGSYKNAQEL